MSGWVWRRGALSLMAAVCEPRIDLPRGMDEPLEQLLEWPQALRVAGLSLLAGLLEQIRKRGLLEAWLREPPRLVWSDQVKCVLRGPGLPVVAAGQDQNIGARKGIFLPIVYCVYIPVRERRLPPSPPLVFAVPIAPGARLLDGPGQPGDTLDSLGRMPRRQDLQGQGRPVPVRLCGARMRELTPAPFVRAPDIWLACGWLVKGHDMASLFHFQLAVIID